MNINSKIIKLFSLFLILILCGWGSTGHKIINQNSTLSFPPQMKAFVSWSGILAQHASDADYRKSADKTESPKHFIDIDYYPEFLLTGRISQSYDSLVAEYGSSVVIAQGTLPWAIVAAYDTLKNCFERKDFDKAVLTAADLGHYVADSHQPLHITSNYNPGGLHSRYETNMIDTYKNQIQYGGDSVQYIADVSGYVFNYIYKNYRYVDSLIHDDLAAKAVNSDIKSAAYYQALWNLTGNFTVALFDSASWRLASLIYTAWTNAGSPLPPASFVASHSFRQMNFKLEQNYPNPCNPATKINYSVPTASFITIKVYDIIGNEVASLVNEEKSAGSYSVSLNGSRLSSGIYFYRMNASANLSAGTVSGFTDTKKLILLK